jgi:hypothetical protein
MYLHIIKNSPTFINVIKNIFNEAAPGANQYLILKEGTHAVDPSEENLYIKDVKGFLNIYNKRTDWKGVFIHGLSIHIAPIIKKIPDNIKIAWYVWGHEAYDYWPPLTNMLFQPKTRSRIFVSSPFFSKRLLIDRYNTFYLRELKRVFNRFDVCICRSKQEYDLFRESGLIEASTSWKPGSVGYLEYRVDVDEPVQELGKNIQIGNSASFSNNHLEVLDKLKGFDLSDRKLFFPLSYGNHRYRRLVIKHGIKLFGPAFMPVTELMPIEKYRELIQSCGIIIMNHNRQQGLGNITLGLWRGAKIFLNNTSVYKHYKALGAHIFSIEDDFDPVNTSSLEPLSYDQVITNREVIKREANKNKVLKRIHDILAYMN